MRRPSRSWVRSSGGWRCASPAAASVSGLHTWPPRASAMARLQGACSARTADAILSWVKAFTPVRSSTRLAGPSTVGPAAQNAAIGRSLMTAVMDRAAERGAAGVRLVQTAYHTRSLALYAKLGFEVREPLACLQGPPPGVEAEGYAVRPAMAA